jgi:hypothetical protein
MTGSEGVAPRQVGGVPSAKTGEKPVRHPLTAMTKKEEKAIMVILESEPAKRIIKAVHEMIDVDRKHRKKIWDYFLKGET